MVLSKIPIKLGRKVPYNHPTNQGPFFRGSNAVEPDWFGTFFFGCVTLFDTLENDDQQNFKCLESHKNPEHILNLDLLVWWFGKKVPNIFRYSLKLWCKVLMNSMFCRGVKVLEYDGSSFNFHLHPHATCKSCELKDDMPVFCAASATDRKRFSWSTLQNKANVGKKKQLERGVPGTLLKLAYTHTIHVWPYLPTWDGWF